MSKPSDTKLSGDQIHDMLAQADTGGRHPTGSFPRMVLFYIPLAWTLFQLWYASPLPYMFNIFVLNSSEARSIHLAFAIFLSYTAFPTLKSSPKDYIPLQDWIIALIGAFCAGYLFLFYNELSGRPGNPTTLDLVVAVTGLILLLEATRRALGPPLMVVATVFIIYTFAGAYMPNVIAHKGASLVKGMSHYWLTTEGVYGVALGVSTSMVFMFVLFGSLLESDRLRRTWPSAWRSGQGSGGLLGHDRACVRLLHCQRGHHRNFYHSADAQGRLFRGKGGRHRGGFFHQRPAHTAGHGGRRLSHG